MINIDLVHGKKIHPVIRCNVLYKEKTTTVAMSTIQQLPQFFQQQKFTFFSKTNRLLFHRFHEKKIFQSIHT